MVNYIIYPLLIKTFWKINNRKYLILHHISTIKLFKSQPYTIQISLFSTYQVM